KGPTIGGCPSPAGFRPATSKRPSAPAGCRPTSNTAGADPCGSQPAPAGLYRSIAQGLGDAMISQKAKYAFKALFHLAELPPGLSASIEGIARGEAIPRRFLEHILLQLKRGRIVASHRGPHGGYRLVVTPAEL